MTPLAHQLIEREKRPRKLKMSTLKPSNSAWAAASRQSAKGQTRLSLSLKVTPLLPANSYLLTTMHFDQPIPHLPAPFRMLHIPGGTFRMGSPPGTPDSDDNERPDHDVTLSDFWLGELPVTQDLWQAVMGDNPSDFKGLRRPVEMVSWNDAQTFIQTLNSLTNKTYRLPTEAEWEYAARGGNTRVGFQYAGSDLLAQVGWCRENSDDQTHEVGLLLPNELGLYDMSGNVWEWCQDHWHDNYEGAPEDGSAWEEVGKALSRVVRGGSWSNNAWVVRAAERVRFNPNNRVINNGFRLART